jgi:hypothetical protein
MIGAGDEEIFTGQSGGSTAATPISGWQTYGPGCGERELRRWGGIKRWEKPI